MADILQWCDDASSPANTGTSVIKGILEDGGNNTVTLISDEDSVPADISGYSLMVVDPSCDGPTLDAATKLRDLDIGVLVMHPGTPGADMELWSGTLANSSSDEYTIVLDTHPLANGRSNGTYQIYGSAQNQKATVASTADIRVMQRGSGSASYIVFGYDTGGSGDAGFTMPNRRVFFGITADAALAALLDTTKADILNAAEWTGQFGQYASGAYTLTADAGSVAITGQDVALNYSSGGDVEMAANAGTYAITGVAVTFERKVTSLAGMVTIAGQDATLTVGEAAPAEIDADAGTVTITGVAASLRAGRMITAEPGTVDLTGVPVTFDAPEGSGATTRPHRRRLWAWI